MVDALANSSGRHRDRAEESRLREFGLAVVDRSALPKSNESHEFLLEGTRAVLLEFPGSWLDVEDDSSLVLEAADRLLAVELVPVIAHPERSIGLRADFGIAERWSSMAASCARRRLGTR